MSHYAPHYAISVIPIVQNELKITIKIDATIAIRWVSKSSVTVTPDKSQTIMLESFESSAQSHKLEIGNTAIKKADFVKLNVFV